MLHTRRWSGEKKKALEKEVWVDGYDVSGSSSVAVRYLQPILMSTIDTCGCIFRMILLTPLEHFCDQVHRSSAYWWIKRVFHTRRTVWKKVWDWRRGTCMLAVQEREEQWNLDPVRKQRDRMLGEGISLPLLWLSTWTVRTERVTLQSESVFNSKFSPLKNEGLL